MTILIDRPEHPTVTPAHAVTALLAAARRIGHSGMTLEDLKTLHAYRNVALNYDQHLAAHEGRETEVILAEAAIETADQLARLRNREAEEADREREEEAQPSVLFAADSDPFGDALLPLGGVSLWP